jgi:hypothetical protein
MGNLLSTTRVARLLGIRPGRLTKAIWDGRLAPPERGPGNGFVWSEADINRATKLLLGRPASDFLTAKEGGKVDA